MNRITLLLLILFISHFGVNSQNKFQSRAHTPQPKFVYTDCGCDAGINLTIYNGLIAPWGGQAIPEDKEEFPGAVTVANKNNTDGDQIIDNVDDYVIHTQFGKDEVDLMRLDIKLVGQIPSDCTIKVKLEYNGNIKFWQKSTKEINITNLEFYLSPTNSIITIWVEAIETSSDVRDIMIRALVNNIEQDKVKATAIWCDPIATVCDRTPDPEPSSIGIDQPNLLQIINQLAFACDNTRYGFGENAIDPNNSQCTNLFFGGRVLFRFSIKPISIINELGLFGINFDVTRRVFDEYNQVTTISQSMFIKTNMPTLSDESNDEKGTNNEDNDNEPFPSHATEIFSFDGPSVNIKGGWLVMYRNFIAEEYARVSFGAPLVGNNLSGSRCSNKQNWNMQDALVRVTTDATDPYNIAKQKLVQLNSPIAYSQPVLLAGNGNGQINIYPLTNFASAYYLLVFDQNQNLWNLTQKIAGIVYFISSSTYNSSNGTWTLIDQNVIEIVISDNGTFTHNTNIVIGTINDSRINNTLNCN